MIYLPTVSELKTLIDRGARFFATEYCYTIYKPPNNQPVDMLFPDYEYLDEWWDAYEHLEPVAIKKTAKMICTWWACIGYLFDVLWRENWNNLALSKKERLVDDGGENSSVKSQLGRVRFLYKRLPEWMRDMQPLTFTHLKVVNPQMESMIDGETANPDAGRSGDYMRAWVDETAFVPKMESVHSAIHPRCVQEIYTSTSNGKGNAFYRLCTEDNSGFRVIRAGWWDHPDKRCSCTDPLDLDPEKHSGCWYAKESEGMTPVQRARELNMDDEASTGGKVFYTWSDDFVGKVPLIPGQRVYRFWDFGVGDQTAIWYAQLNLLHTKTGRAVKQLRIFDAYRNSGMGARHYREVCQAKAESYRGAEVIDVGDPHNLSSRTQAETVVDGKLVLASWLTSLKDDSHPYKIYCRPSGCRGVDLETVIDSARKFMVVVTCQDSSRQPRMMIDESLRSAITCVEQWGYPVDEEGQIIGTKPKHDENSHWGTALYYGTYYLDPASGSGVIDPKDAAIDTESRIFDEAGMNW